MENLHGIKMTHNKIDRLAEMEKAVKASFSKIREEMEEHLDSINENTKEIEGIYKYIFGLEEKIEKLNERIDDVCMQLGKKEAYENFELTEKLSIREQEVFLILYAQVENNGPLCYRDISKKLGLTESLVRECVAGLIGKGVPIIKRYINNKTYLDIDPTFKQVQVKKNVLQINENLSKEII